MKIDQSRKTSRRLIAIAAIAGTFQVSKALATDFLWSGAASDNLWSNPADWNNLGNATTGNTFPGNSTAQGGGSNNQAANAVFADTVFDYSPADNGLSATIAPLSGTTVSLGGAGFSETFDTISFGFYSATEGAFTLSSNFTIGNAGSTINLNTSNGGLTRLAGGKDGTGGQNNGLSYGQTTGIQTIASNLVVYNATSQTWALNGTGEVLLTGSLSTTAGQSVIKSKSAELEFSVSNANTFLGNYAAQAGTTLLDNNTALGPTTSTVQVSGVSSAQTTSLLINTGVTYAYNTVVVTPKAGYQQATLGAQSGETGAAWTGNIQVNDGVTLTSPGSGKSITFSGIISDGTGGTDLAGSSYSFVNSNLIKATAGTVILSGANSYTGSTNVSAGTLQAGIANTAFGNNSAVILTNVATSILALNSFNQTIGSLTGGGSTGGNVTLGTATLTVGGDNTSPGAYAGIISGTGGLNKVGTGTLTLTGANTYSGNTNISGGIVNLGVADTSGTSGPLGKASGVGSILLGGGTLQYSAANQHDYSNRFSTAAGQHYNVDTNGQTLTWATALTSSGASFLKQGTGTLNLTGADTYSGSTTVNNGTLNLGGGTANGSLSSSSLVLGGGSFVYSRTGTNVQSFTGTTINAGLSSISNTATNDVLNLGALSPQPGGSVDFTTLTGTVTTTTANTNGILGSWATANSGTTWAIATGTGPVYNISSYTNYTETSVALNTPTNYTGLFIDVNSSQTPTGGLSVASLRFNTAAAETLTLTGTNIVSTGGILITPNVGTNGSFITGGTLEGPAGGTLFFNQNNTSAGGSVNVSSVIADNTTPTALAKNGLGTLILAGSNTYSGTTYVNSGVLSAGVATSAFGNASPVIISSGATLDLSASGLNETIGSLASTSIGAGSVTLGGNTLSIGSNNTSTGFSGVISGSGGLTKIGTATLTLSGQNTYTGATTLSGGLVNLGSTENFGVSGPLGNVASGSIVFAGGSLQYSSSNTYDYSARFSTAAAQPFSVDTNGQNVTWASVLNSAGGTLTKIGAGNLTLSAVNTYTGATNITGGTLSAGVASGATGGAFGLNSAVSIASGATLNLNSYATTIGSLTGTGNVTLSTSKLTLGTDNTSTTYAGVISGAGAVVKAGAGTLTLTGANTYTGNANISAGIVNLASVETPGVSGPIGVGTIVLGGGTLQYTGSNTFDYSSRFGTANYEHYNVDTNGQNITWTTALNSPGGTLNKFGNGTLTLSGASKYSGATTVDGGTLIANQQSTGTTGAFGNDSAVTLNGSSGAILNLNGFNNAIGSLTGGGYVTLGAATLTVGADGTSPAAFTGIISGNGGLTKVGAGTFQVSGSNTYSGVTNLSGGIMTVGVAENPGTSGPLGTSAALNPGSILFSGGTLQYSPNNTFDYSGRFSIAANQQYSVDTNGQNVVWSQPLVSSGGSLTKLGAGTLEIPVPASYTGTTTISAGTLTVDASASLPSGTALTVNGTLNLNSAALTVASLNGSGTVNLKTPLTVSGGGSFSGAIADAASPGSLVVSGGTLALSGASTYSGGTNISGGTLQVGNTTGSATGSGPVTVGNGGTLGGSGSISGVVTVTANGTLQPDLTSSLIPTTLTIGSGSVLAGTTILDLIGDIGSVGANQSDEIVFGGTGAAVLGGSVIVQNPNAFAPTVGDSFTLFSFNSSTGSFPAGSVSLPALAPGLSWDTSGLASNGSIGVVTGPANGTWAGTSSAGNWEDSSQWAGQIIPTSAGSTATFGDSIGSSAATVTLTAPETVGVINFNGSAGGSYTLNSSAPANRLTLNNSSGPAVVSVNSGVQTINAAIVLTGGLNVITAAGSSLTLGGIVNGSGPLTITGGSTTLITANGSIGVPLVVAGNLSFANNADGSTYLVRSVPSLNVSGSVTLAATANQSNRQLLVIGGGASGLINTGLIDLGNNDLVLQAGGTAGLTQITSLIHQGYNGGSWQAGTGTTTGITSSAAENDRTHLTALGIVLNNTSGGSAAISVGGFDSYTPATGDVLVKYTYYGDANLDGSVSSADYTLIDGGFLSQGGPAPLTGWQNGDFNYDGVINGSDYTLIDNAFNTQGATLALEIASPTAQIAGGTGVSAVPEPTALGLFGLGAVGLLGRRRRGAVPIGQ